MSCNNTTITNCGCLTNTKGSCVFYQGSNLTCLGVTKGDDYDSILVSLNSKICDLEPPSAIPTIVEGCDNINVSSSTTDGITTYTVCLDSSITDEITNNTADIATLFTCVESNVTGLVSDTISISEDSSTSCGKILRIELPSPSGTPTYDGIVYNDTTKSNYTNTTGDKLLKAYVRPFVSVNNIGDGDEIIYTATGQIKGDGIIADSVKLELWSGGVSVYSEFFGGFSAITDSYSSWLAKIILTVSDRVAGDGLLNLEFLSNVETNGTLGGLARNCALQINKEVSGIDYDDLEVRVIYVHDSTSAASVNYARQLKVEVRKNIAI